MEFGTKTSWTRPRRTMTSSRGWRNPEPSEAGSRRSVNEPNNTAHDTVDEQNDEIPELENETNPTEEGPSQREDWWWNQGRGWSGWSQRAETPARKSSFLSSWLGLSCSTAGCPGEGKHLGDDQGRVRHRDRRPGFERTVGRRPTAG